MLAKLLVVVLVVFILLYLLVPNLQRTFNNWWTVCQNWFNEHEAQGNCKVTEESIKVRPVKPRSTPNIYKAKRSTDRVDDQDPTCFWRNDRLICP